MRHRHEWRSGSGSFWLMSNTYVFSVQAFGCHIQATAACAEANAILQRFIFPTLPRAAGAEGRPDISIRVDRAANQFQLFVDDSAAAAAPQAVGLVPEIIRAVDDAVIQRLAGMRAVHAGVVVWDRQALLLPGASHAGKSSLVAELLRRGATYFSDEYALIDAEGRVHPYPRPLLVRNGAPEQFPVLANELGAVAGQNPARAGWILSLQYMPACRWSIAPVSQSEALLILLRNTPHVLTESPNMVSIFQRAVAGALCYTGRRNEAVHAVDEILRLVDRLAA